MLFDLEKMNKVAFDDMNEVHTEELELANSIYDYLISTNEHDHSRIEKMLEEFAYHLRDHFLFEEDMMAETNCPILGCHSNEHKRVQKIMFQIFHDYALSKKVDLLKLYFEFEFKIWIENHILTMDTVTGAYLKNPEAFTQSNVQAK
jgi:hemerythrin